MSYETDNEGVKYESDTEQTKSKSETKQNTGESANTETSAKKQDDGVSEGVKSKKTQTTRPDNVKADPTRSR